MLYIGLQRLLRRRSPLAPEGDLRRGVVRSVVMTALPGRPLAPVMLTQLPSAQTYSSIVLAVSTHRSPSSGFSGLSSCTLVKRPKMNSAAPARCRRRSHRPGSG